MTVDLMNPCSELISSLPGKRGWRTPRCHQFQGFWYTSLQVQAAIAFQQHFLARDGDLLLITQPKSGTTWLKALVFAIVNRTRYKDTPQHHPLLTHNPHDLVPFAEQLHGFGKSNLDLANLPFPRILATHCPRVSLSESALNSGSRIVYLCRNPKDTFVSWWHFTNKLREADQIMPPISVEEALEMFCSGVSDYGPYWDHVLGYWKESLERPERVLFLKYEEMKEDPVLHLKRLARHLGYPFAQDTEEEEVEEVSKLCSFENMTTLEVNRGGRNSMGYKCNIYFRRGEVGDWANYLTPEMEERLENITQQRFGSSGLSFQCAQSRGAY